jgi:CHRD domain
VRFRTNLETETANLLYYQRADLRCGCQAGGSEMYKALFQQVAIVTIATLSISTASLGPARGAPVSFKVPLSGGQEVPPVFPAGAATADLTYDPVTRVVTWTLSYTALSSPVTVAEFHGPAQPSKNAPPAVAMVKQGSPVESPITGQATLTPDQAR